MVAAIILLYINICVVLGILNNHDVNPLQFERIFDNGFSNYIFGHKNCYYYEISKDIINEKCLQSTINPSTDNRNDNPNVTSTHWHMPYNTNKIFQSNTFKRRILDTNTDCYIGTLHLCSSTLPYESKAYAFKKLKIPLQTCFSINIVDSKVTGVGIQLFQIKDCISNLYQQTELSEPFILCADDTVTTINNGYFCDKNEQCITNFEVPNICTEEQHTIKLTPNPTYKPTMIPVSMPTITTTIYDGVMYTHEPTNNPTLRPTINIEDINPNVPKNPLTIDHNNNFNNFVYVSTNTMEPSKVIHTNINELDLIQKNNFDLNVKDSNKTIIPEETKWVIGIAVLIGICIILNMGLIWGWKYYMCESHVNETEGIDNSKIDRELFWFQKDYKEKDIDCCSENELENNNSDIDDLEYKQEEQLEQPKISESIFARVYANLVNNDFYTDAENSDAELHDHVLDID